MPRTAKTLFGRIFKRRPTTRLSAQDSTDASPMRSCGYVTLNPENSLSAANKDNMRASDATLVDPNDTDST